MTQDCNAIVIDHNASLSRVAMFKEQGSKHFYQHLQRKWNTVFLYEWEFSRISQSHFNLLLHIGSKCDNLFAHQICDQENLKL